MMVSKLSMVTNPDEASSSSFRALYLSVLIMKIDYPPHLPITAEKDTILETIKNNQITIIEGDTGSGKTTQLPKICLEAFTDLPGIIGCTQPRRIAATSISARVSEELKTAGNLAGYKIRFYDSTTADTKIKFMTDGVLLAETRNDPLLKKYSAIIIDEAHERSLNIDFLLGYIKQLLPKRPDLKVIITSATIDTQAFSSHFGNAPVISVSGRTYPVEVDYKPLEDEEDTENLLDHVVESTRKIFKNPPEGDVLIFLATERDIRECCKLLEKQIPNAIVLPLFGRLSSGDQKRIFQQSRKIKIIVSTNIAETSLTVPGIRYVIDSGQARISQYNTRAKTTSLPVAKISQASADQRKGRCGRVGPGKCIRLYSEEDYRNRSEYSVPEIKRSNLAEVILQMISYKLGNPEDFPFIDPPYKAAIREGYNLLKELKAINRHNKLTSIGRFMADLPIDPCIARILLEAKKYNCLREIKIISAVLAIQDPRIRPADNEKEADLAHQKFHHPHSDFLSILNIWNSFHQESQEKRSWSRLKKFCKSHFLSFQKMREWFDLHEQLCRILDKRGDFKDNENDASYEQIHRAILTGFLRNIAQKKEKRLFQGSQGRELMIFPGSGQFNKSSEWILAANFLETSKLYAHTVAGINQEWIEPAAGHLCKYSWTNPRWSKKRGFVIADESAFLFGLVLRSGTRVNFGKKSHKNVKEARKIFIAEALIPGELNGNYEFLEHNLSMVELWEEAEAKLRVRNIIADQTAFFNFYDQKLAADVYDQKTLNNFLKKKDNKTVLQMSDKDILLRSPGENELANFPPQVQMSNMTLNLEYHFEPGDEKDGVTFRLPLSFAHNVSKERFDWLVPGFIEEKLTFLLKSLPKAIRKKLVPVNNSVERILDDVDFGKGSLLSAIEQSILKHHRLLIQRGEWNQDYPPHLKPRFLLFDNQGKEVCSGRDLGALLKHEKAQLDTAQVQQTSRVKSNDENIIRKWENSQHTNWAFAELPAEIPSFTNSGELSGFLYPALAPDPGKGCVTVFFDNDKDRARQQNIQGSRYLFGIQFKNQLKSLKKQCTNALSGSSAILLARLGKKRTELVDLVLNHVLSALLGPLPEGSEMNGIIAKDVFDAKIREMQKTGFYKNAQVKLDQLLRVLRKKREAEEKIEITFKKAMQKGHRLPSSVRPEFIKTLEIILPGSFLEEEAVVNLAVIEKYIQGVSIRLDRFYANPAKDAQKSAQLKPYLLELEDLLTKKKEYAREAQQEIETFRQMVCDFMLSLFSPEIKGSGSVSPKKLTSQLNKTKALCG